MRRKAVIVLLGVVVALGGSACSSGGDSPTVVTSVSGSTATGSTTTGAATGGEPDTSASGTSDSGRAEPGTAESGSTDASESGSGSASTGVTPAENTGFTGSPSRDDANVDARDFQVAPDRYAFVSPSQNVYCAVSTLPDDPAGAVGCQAVTSVPAANGTVCDNSATNSYAVRIDGGEVTQFCTNQGIYIPSSNPRTLEYGQILMVQSTPCTSTTTAISCWGSGDNGFIISRDINTTLG